MQILDRYVVRVFLSTFGVVLLFVFGIFLVIHVFSLIDSLMEAKGDLEKHGLSVLGVLGRYYFVSIPFFFLRLAPFVTVVSATIALIRLIRGNELTAMVAAGRSLTRITLPIFVLGFLLAVGMLALQQWGVPRLANARIRLERVAKGDLAGRVDDIPPIEDGYGNVWRIEGYLAVGKTMEGVRVIRFHDPETGRLAGRLDIGTATWREDGPGGRGWYPANGILRPAEGSAEYGADRRLPADEPLATDLVPAAVDLQAARRSREAGKMLSLTEAAELVDLYPDRPRQVLSFHSLITWPLGVLLLLLVGLPFIVRLGERNLFVGVGISLLVCAAWFAADTLCQDLGSRAVLPPVLAAWLPVTLFASFAVALYDRIRA